MLVEVAWTALGVLGYLESVAKLEVYAGRMSLLLFCCGINPFLCFLNAPKYSIPNDYIKKELY